MEEESTCRTCMSSRGPFESLYTGNAAGKNTFQLSAMLMSFTNLQLLPDDGLPSTICRNCARKVVDMFEFKQLCEISNLTLQQKLKANLKGDETNSGIESAIVVDNPNINDTDLTEDITDPSKKVSNLYACNICALCYINEEDLNKHKEELHPNDCEDDDDGDNYNDNDNDNGDDMEYLEPKVEIQNDEDSESGPQENRPASQLKCPICDEFSSSMKEFDIHLKIHAKQIRIKKKKLECDLCTKTYNKLSHLTRHFKSHIAKPFSCTICNKYFKRIEQYQGHMNIHSGIKKAYVCQICNKGFTQMSNLKDHIRTHNGDQPFLCSTCGKGFNQLGNLRQHAIRHTGLKMHQCDLCNKCFSSKGELQAHTRKHTGARPFICSVCHNGFTTSSSLKKHFRIHSGERPYECDICKMRFSRSGVLVRHKRVHTGEKPYMCSICGKAFSQSNDLASHTRIHTGERPYVCDVCGMAFRQNGALRSHKRVHDQNRQKTARLRSLENAIKNELASSTGMPAGSAATIIIQALPQNSVMTYTKMTQQSTI